MKKIFSFIFLLISIAGITQSKLYIRGDTIQIERSGGNAELILLNSTRARTNGFLKNTGNGKTGFAYAVDSVYKANDSSLVVRRGDGLDTLIVGAGILDTTTIYKTFEIPINAGQRVQVVQAHSATFTSVAGQSIINLKNGNLLMIFNMAANNVDLENADTKMFRKISTDDGVSWGDTVQVLPANFGAPGGAGGGSLYRNVDTIFNVFWVTNDADNLLYRIFSVDEGITWSAPVLKYTVNNYNAPSFDRALVATNGTLWMPYNDYIGGGLTSATGRWDGKLLKSSNYGATITEGGVTFATPAPDTLCVENGIVQVSDTLYHYCRNRSGDVVMWKSTNGLTGTTWSAAFSSGLKAPNSMSRIMYDEPNKLWIGIHNEVYQGDITNGINARYKLAISTSYRDVGQYAHWQNVYSVDVQRGYHFSGPSAFRWKDKLIVGYDARKYYGGDSLTYDLRQKIVPIENLLPSRNIFFDRVYVRGRPEALQDSLGGSYLQMKLFDVGVASVKDGWYAINNNAGHQTANAFAPEINILTGGGSTYGVQTIIDAPALALTNDPYFKTTFLRAGATPPSSGTYAVLREDWVGTTKVFTSSANGKIELRNPELGAGNNFPITIAQNSSDGVAYIIQGYNADFKLYSYAGPAWVLNPDGNLNAPLVSSGAADTTTYKPLGISSGGNIRKMASWPAGAGGGGSPGGSNTEVQFNNSGAFGGGCEFHLYNWCIRCNRADAIG